MDKIKVGKWIDDGRLPACLDVVIVRFKGKWPGREEESGYADLYTYKGKWFNCPEGIEITGWMPHRPTYYDPQDGIEQKYDPVENPVGEWIDASILPPEGMRVIGIFEGSASGITETRYREGNWTNLHKGVSIECWMYDPDEIARLNVHNSERNA